MNQYPIRHFRHEPVWWVDDQRIQTPFILRHVAITITAVALGIMLSFL